MGRRESAQSDEVLRAIENESDRGCVLVSAAWMEDLLRNIIREVVAALDLLSEYEVAKKEHESLLRFLIDGDGGLGRSNYRVSFLRAFGFLDAPAVTALSALFQLRNQHFAHFAGVSRLQDPLVAQKLKEFNDAANESQPRKYAVQVARTKKYSKSRIAFMESVGRLVITIMECRASMLAKSTAAFKAAKSQTKRRIRTLERRKALLQSKVDPI